MSWTGEGLKFESQQGREFSLLKVVQTESGAHPASYPMVTGGSFQGGKASRREADHSTSTSIEDKKMWIYTSTPPYVFMA
jgi:hypothetical protein